mgnify:CR=1 FL=1
MTLRTMRRRVSGSGSTGTTGDRLYVLSGDAAMPDLEALCQAGTTEREWLALTAGTAEGLPLRFFSGTWRPDRVLRRPKWC